MNVTIKNGGEYFNKGKACIWVELHDGTKHKFIIQTEDSAKPEEPADWIITSATRQDAIVKELLAGETLASVSDKYGMRQ